MVGKKQYDNPAKAILKGISDLLSKKTDSLSLPDTIDLSGKSVMITGSSSGLGYATAMRIARAGAKLIMAVRSGIPDKGDAVRSQTGNQNILMYQVDLSDFNSINTMLNTLENDGIFVDILISNAAMVPLKSRKTPQGLEEMFMVNYLSAFYLINEMTVRKIIAPDGKIIIVSSESHRNPETFDWENFGKYREYGIGETVARYGYFKLLLTTFGNELARRLNNHPQRIPVRILCPGPVNSNIAREAPGWMQPVLRLVFSLFFRSPEKASDPIIYFASETDDRKNAVDYMFLMQTREMDEKATNEENGRKLWQYSEDLIRKLGYWKFD